MDTLKRRHHFTPTPDSPPPKYSDTFESVDFYCEKESKIFKSNQKTKATSLYAYSTEFIRKYQHWIAATLLTLISVWTRFRLIGKARKVIWDEAHFGKFGSFYLKNEFYFDVHPPLGKMLVGFSGVLANYNGSFSFESGQTYPDDLDIVTMRVFNAAWGVMLVPLAYGTARYLGLSIKSCILAATMVLLDNALLTISRFVLLDSMLLFFTGATFFCLAGFRSKRDEPFSLAWWAWMFGLGMSLGCVLSVKWVGLFAVALAGTYTLEDLWDMLGDLQMPKKTYFCHWLARGVCLIAIPSVIYVASFAAHFYLLSNSGPGDANMSSLFQARLNGSSFKNNPLEIVFGSNVTIKNVAYGGGLLHSHPHMYPDGSKQQQITGYGFKDDNNLWQVRYPRTNDSTQEQKTHESDSLEFLQDGDIIRLYHLATHHNLHSHPIYAPVSTKHWEVSAYGSEEVGDVQDNWRVEIVKDMSDKDTKQVKALSTRFRLRHIFLDCLLASHNVLLPQWGFRQQEVVCDRKSLPSDPHTWWNIEDNHHSALPPAPENAYRSHFWQDFWHLNVMMWHSNNALVPDPDKDDLLASGPTEWPLVSVGLRMCSWDEKSIKYYLIGNPVVWWSSTLAIVSFVMATGVYMIRKRRHLVDMTPGRWNQFCSVGKLFFLGWFFHYIPFYMMGRITYIHHYFPALYFSVFMVPFLLEHFVESMSVQKRYAVYGIMFCLVIVNFVYFAPFSFGMEGDIKLYANRHWFKHWNLIENRNHF
ncbi:Protein O-mannosyltransferase 2 [Rhizopus stolonifer]|uniref:Dolichyl-phosphate-mannose--protein mannosyltransferase n=1 Tax=Rhizopus stolonifer TaxID=4846 RepID=A0A367KY67_RHIST|nr:Protein O-mannosyltransferase 2 [Rhizopus stolonifer]